jgi:hypothetical protein
MFMRLLRTAVKTVLLLLVVLIAWSAVRINAKPTAFRREITVNVPREVAWEHFNRPREWVSWLGAQGAPTSVSTDVVGPETTATFAGNFTFRMTDYAPPDHWMWSAKLGWLTVDYDHIFQPLGERRTRMVFHQTVTGFGSDVLALLLGGVTAATGHQAALNRLADELNQLPAAAQ